MKPKKNILIYHPDREEGALLRYAMQITLVENVDLARNVREIADPGDKYTVTVRWNKELIELRNNHANTYRTLPATCSRLDLMEAVKISSARKPGRRPGSPASKRQRVALRVKLAKVHGDLELVERMMHLAAPRKSRFAA